MAKWCYCITIYHVIYDHSGYDVYMIRIEIFMKTILLFIVLVFGIGFGMSAQASLWSWLLGKKEVVVAPTDGDNHEGHDHEIPIIERKVGTIEDFHLWQANNPDESQKAKAYEYYLRAELGNTVPPMNELLTSARSWQECGYEPYQVPPQELWSNMIPTLKLYNTLKQQGIIPRTAQIRSVYRSPALNQCAGGASGSKHMSNSAIDIWVPEYGDNSLELYQMKDRLCQFWQMQGQPYEFGLGLYATGAIHLDTQGYRKWGLQFSSIESPCRAIQEKLYIDGQF